MKLSNKKPKKSRDPRSYSTPLSEYGKWHFQNVGFNFRNIRTGEVLRKSEYYDRYISEVNPEWQRIPFEPITPPEEKAPPKRIRFLD